MFRVQGFRDLVFRGLLAAFSLGFRGLGCRGLDLLEAAFSLGFRGLGCRGYTCLRQLLV